MILYFVLQLVFAVLVALACAFVLAIAGIYVSFEQWHHASLVMRCSPDDREEADFLLRLPRARAENFSELRQ
jgi:hypothetical protein